MTDKLDAIPGSTGRKIIDGLKDAAAGNFSSVWIEGQRWVRADAPQTLDPVKRVTGCTSQVEEAACLIFAELCPGMVMGDEDLPHYEAAAKAVLALPRSAAIAAEPQRAPASCPHCIDATDCASVDVCCAVEAVYAAPTTSPEPSADLQKVADVIEPHWRGAGVELTADWVIAEYIGLGKELDETRAQLEASPEPDAVRDIFDRLLELYFPLSEKQPPLVQQARAALSRPAHGGWEELRALFDAVGIYQFSPTGTAEASHAARDLDDAMDAAKAALARNDRQGGEPQL